MSHGQVATATVQNPTTPSSTNGPQLVSVPSPDGKGFAPYSPNAVPRQAFAAIPGNKNFFIVVTYLYSSWSTTEKTN